MRRPLLGGALFNVLTLASRGLEGTRAHKSSATRVTDRRISQTEAQSLNFFPLCVLWNSKQRSHRSDSRVSNPLGARKIGEGLGSNLIFVDLGTCTSVYLRDNIAKTVQNRPKFHVLNAKKYNG